MNTCSIIDSTDLHRIERSNYVSRRALLLLAALLSTASSASAQAPDLEIKSIKVPSGNEYTLFYQGPLAASFEIKRPDKSDNAVKLCIPCAFTSYVGSIDGVYIHDGKLHHRHFVADNFGGAAIIQNGTISLMPTNKGKALTPKFLDELAKKKASFFQQFLVVEHGQAAHFKDKTLFQRRAIAKLKDGKTALFESKTAITLNSFGQDLKNAGAVDALYTDMGAYDEGWYRETEKSVKPMGLDRSLTNKQTNWLTFRKRAD
ncbi:MAG: hypothetical protein C0507_15710 [Cyanobacteria bacterium PR.3.49]|nr:hypothetical protein [Cyanobacteria bacterium PR.3.49]